MIDKTLKMFSFLFLLLAVVSCDGSNGSNQAAYPPPTVNTISVKPENVPLRKEYPGRLVAIRLAEVRARVSGIVLARTFAEGKDVKKGEILFQIDPAKFQASVDAAKAQLERAQASLALAVQQESRSDVLLSKSVATRDQYEIAVANRREAEAEVSVAKANLKTAELDLGYASVRSPIDGRIGAALVTEGAFVRDTDATQMATVRDLTSLYVDFTAPLADLNQVKRDAPTDAPNKSDTTASVELINNDGTTFGQVGTLLFSSAVVDETTGQVSLRAEIKNPQQTLLPGTYVRVRMTQGVAENALLVPQRAVQWDTFGRAKVMTVQDGKAEPRPIVTAGTIGNRWLVTKGLQAGDQVIVDGADKATPGSPVTAEAVKEVSSGENECASVCDMQAKL